MYNNTITTYFQYSTSYYPYIVPYTGYPIQQQQTQTNPNYPQIIHHNSSSAGAIVSAGTTATATATAANVGVVPTVGFTAFAAATAATTSNCVVDSQSQHHQQHHNHPSLASAICGCNLCSSAATHQFAGNPAVYNSGAILNGHNSSTHVAHSSVNHQQQAVAATVGPQFCTQLPSSTIIVNRFTEINCFDNNANSHTANGCYPDQTPAKHLQFVGDMVSTPIFFIYEP